MRQQEKTQQMQVVIEEEENDYDNIIEWNLDRCKEQKNL